MDTLFPYLERLCPGNPVVQVDVSVVGAAQDLQAVAAEPEREEAEAAVVRTQGERDVALLVTMDIDLVN